MRHSGHHRSNHESEKDDEQRGAYPGSHLADFETLRAQDPFKKAIETLLEEGFMERVDGSNDTFAYIA